MNAKQERAFAKKFCDMLDCADCDLTPREKRKLKLSMMLNRFVRKSVIDQFDDTYSKQPVGLLSSAGLSSVTFTAIDWENFDWEKAADFWTEILKVVIEIVMLFI
jgi:hypothetical protein